MLAAGTGITPMYQALQRLFGKDEDAGDDDDDDDENVSTKIVLIYGSRTRRDIYLRKELADMQNRFPDRLKVIYALSDDSRGARGARGDEIMVDGKIDKGVIAMTCQDEIFRKRGGGGGGGGSKGRDGDCKVWVCGPPAFYNDLCGPRDDVELTAGCALRELGFDARDVVKF